MPTISQLGTLVRVTPSDDIQIVHSDRDQDFTFIDDRSPFIVRVDGIIEEGGEIIGVHGGVVSGHERYLDQIGTLFVRLDNSNWRRDNRSAAQFKVGLSVATPNGKHPFYHPEGTDIAGFPFIVRYGSLDSRGEYEGEINFAKNPPETTQAEQDADTNA